MNARDVITKALEQCNGKRMPEFEAANVYALLNRSGFTIMSKEDVEAVRDKALEEAARHLDGWGDMYGDNSARAIRSLKSKEGKIDR